MEHESTDNAQVEALAIPVVSRVAGYINQVTVSDYQAVSDTQLLVKIDDREFVLAVEQAKADIVSAQSDLANANAQLQSSQVNQTVAQANVDVQQVRLDKAQADLQRDENLFADHSITQKQLDDSRSNVLTAQKQLKASQDQVAYAVSQIANARAQAARVNAQIELKKVALDNAKLRLSYCVIHSPISGKVGKTNLQPGQYVQPGQTLFTIVNNQKFWVTANFKETQIASFHEGMEAEITLDGYPEQKIKAKIVSFSEATGARFALLPPDNATGNFVKVTQRVPVKLEILNLKEVAPILRAGLSAEVEIKTK